MAKIDKPEIGAELYSVFGHLYSSKLAPHRVLKEYCVCKGTVRGFYTGSYTDVCMLFQGPNGTPTLSYYKLEDIGKKLFYTAAEAAELAAFSATKPSSLTVPTLASIVQVTFLSVAFSGRTVALSCMEPPLSREETPPVIFTLFTGTGFSVMSLTSKSTGSDHCPL